MFLRGITRRDAGVELEQACVPEGHRAYVIGDVHGRADLLAEALEWIARETAPGSDHNHLINLGDYVDRGHQSRNVIDVILNAGLPAVEQVTLMGNHEEAMLAFLEDPIKAAEWLWFGGDATLLSYGVAMAAGVATPAKLQETA